MSSGQPVSKFPVSDDLPLSNGLTVPRIGCFTGENGFASGFEVILHLLCPKLLGAILAFAKKLCVSLLFPEGERGSLQPPRRQFDNPGPGRLASRELKGPRIP